jgi:hypothetical protein
MLLFPIQSNKNPVHIFKSYLYATELIIVQKISVFPPILQFWTLTIFLSFICNITFRRLDSVSILPETEISPVDLGHLSRLHPKTETESSVWNVGF